MNYKNYPSKAQVSSRMARKHMRRDVFTANKKMAKLWRKAAILERRQKEVE